LLRLLQGDLTEPEVFAAGLECGVVVVTSRAENRGGRRLSYRESSPEGLQVLERTEIPPDELPEVALTVQGYDVAISPRLQQVMRDVERTHPARASIEKIEAGGAVETQPVLEDVRGRRLEESAPHAHVDEQVDVLGAKPRAIERAASRFHAECERELPGGA